MACRRQESDLLEVPDEGEVEPSVLDSIKVETHVARRQAEPGCKGALKGEEGTVDVLGRLGEICEKEQAQ